MRFFGVSENMFPKNRSTPLLVSCRVKRNFAEKPQTRLDDRVDQSVSAGMAFP
jgi:hypothetical protein